MESLTDISVGTTRNSWAQPLCGFRLLLDGRHIIHGICSCSPCTRSPFVTDQLLVMHATGLPTRASPSVAHLPSKLIHLRLPPLVILFPHSLLPIPPPTHNTDALNDILATKPNLFRPFRHIPSAHLHLHRSFKFLPSPRRPHSSRNEPKNQSIRSRC